MIRTIRKIAFTIAIITLAIFFVCAPTESEEKLYYKTSGISNGKFFGEDIFVKTVDPFSMKVGEFPLARVKGSLVVHPIIEIVKVRGRTIGYYTKGIKNKYVDEILLPFEIEGRAFRIMENGEVEEDTKYIEITH